MKNKLFIKKSQKWVQWITSNLSHVIGIPIGYVKKYNFCMRSVKNHRSPKVILHTTWNCDVYTAFLRCHLVSCTIECQNVSIMSCVPGRFYIEECCHRLDGLFIQLIRSLCWFYELFTVIPWVPPKISNVDDIGISRHLDLKSNVRALFKVEEAKSWILSSYIAGKQS